MRGVVILGDQQVVVRRLPDPSPDPDQVLVRVHAAGICGSDLQSSYWKTREEMSSRHTDTLVSGHEASGVVLAVGQGVERVKVGDRVVVWMHCSTDCASCVVVKAEGDWFCRAGDGDPIIRSPDGANADLLLAREWQCMPLLPELSHEIGVMLACDGGTAYNLCRKLSIQPGETVLVNGAGPLGIACAMFARALDTHVIVTDLVQYRLELARAIGADHVVDVDRESLPEAVSDLTSGRGADAVIDASGSVAAQRQAPSVVRSGGRIGLAGFTPEAQRREPVLSTAVIVWKQLRLVGSFVYPPSLFGEIQRFVVDHQMDLADAITHRIGLDNAADGFRLFEDRRTGKVVLVP